MAKEFPKDSLGDRMKEYEAAETERYFMRGLPLYARIDGRAFHTFTRGLESQFPTSTDTHHQLFKAMQYVCRRLVDKLNADMGFVQSDEISLGWKDIKSAPFDGRIFKLESVIASQATGFFYRFAFSQEFDDDRCNPESSCSVDRTILQDRIFSIVPTFDCRVFQVPNIMELVNLFVWRENDAIKNSVSSYAQEFFSANELNGKTQTARMEMLREAGHDWHELPLTVKRGTYYARRNKTISGPEGDYVRTVVEEKFDHEQLAKIENKVGYFFNDEEPVLINRSNNNGDVRIVKIDGRIPDDVRELISDFPNAAEEEDVP